jgi:hypothetical protein
VRGSKAVQLFAQFGADALFVLKGKGTRFNFKESTRRVRLQVLMKGVQPPKLLFGHRDFVEQRRPDSVHDSFQGSGRSFTVFLPLGFTPI